MFPPMSRKIAILTLVCGLLAAASAVMGALTGAGLWIWLVAAAGVLLLARGIVALARGEKPHED